MKINDQLDIKIQRIRKNIFNDVLKYNQQVANQRQLFRRRERQYQQQQQQKKAQLQLQIIKNQQQQKQRNRKKQRQLLQYSYEQQISERKKKQLQEKDNDKKYADLELCYQQYNSKRRLYDLQRMFKRKNYKASLAQDPFRRYKTETYQHNAGSPMSFYNSKTPKQNQYHGRLSNQINSPNTPNVYKNHMYHDSLDNLNIKQDIGLHKTPQKNHRNLNPQQYNTYNNAIHERK